MRRLHRTLQRTGGVPGLLALVWLLAGAVLSMAQPPMSAEAVEKMRKTKAPEDWTVEERLAVRFNPGDMQARRAAAAPNPSDEINHISGQRNPELFLPIEVFESLLRGAFAADAQASRVARSALREGLEAQGFDPETFWPTLETIARVPIRAHREFFELGQKMGKVNAREREAISKKSGEIVAQLCAPQAAALAEARKRFGWKPFDRFLYRAVAPTLFDMSSPDPEWPAELRRREGGCREAAK
jgi:hypothetical protein